MILSKDTKILKFSQYKKSYKVPFIMYADLECLIEKIDGHKDNRKSLSTTKLGKNIQSGFSMSTISSFKTIENNRDVFRGKDCMKEFCEYLLWELAVQIINFKRKNKVINKRTAEIMRELSKNVLYIVKKNMDINMLKVKIIVKFGTIAIIQEKIQVLHIAYVIWNTNQKG